VVYKKFEKNYKTYRTTWSCDAEVLTEKETTLARAAKTKAARETTTTTTTTSTLATATTVVVVATSTIAKQLKHWML
jgi:hypothetical protein